MSSPPTPEPTPATSETPAILETPVTPAVASNEFQIEADDDNTDSAYGSSFVTDTTSLRSSLLEYKWENGRRYHAETDNHGEYWGPNDEKQQAAEDLSHQMHTLIRGGLYEAPISEPERVLDVGCGTGSWAIDFADEHPASQVTGVDISPIQPDFVPPNCTFEVDDINKPWTYPEKHFDFVHIRSMLGTVPNWTEFFKSSMKHIKPGGWVEHGEMSVAPYSDDGTIPAGTSISQWAENWDQVGKKLGITFRVAENSYKSITDAGFINVTERKIKVPVGPWAKDKRLKAWGQWYRFFLLEGLEGFALRSFTDVLGWSYEEAQLFLVEMRKNIMDPKIHAYTELRIVCGQRPMEISE